LLYICNCCTCGCGILRGIAKARVANVIARSPYVCRVEAELCIGCGACVSRCPAEALSEGQPVLIDADRCIGCGVCTLACPTQSLHLEPRPDLPAQSLPASLDEWRATRAEVRGIDMEKIQ
jgi:ferredoxin